jgi:predicted O-methyltransferase YrrM
MEVRGHYAYKNLTISQHTSVPESFEILIKKIKPKQVLEIGTAFGGLTLLIRDLLDNNGLTETKLITYDVYDPVYLRENVSKGSNIDIRVKNVFNHQYNELINKDEISEIIQSNGVTLVLCDGGSKKNEFRILSDYLKPGDVIMAHDYAPNETYFQEHINNKIWNWLEIQDSDINESCVKNNLIPYMEDEFRQVVWVCKIKE